MSQVAEDSLMFCLACRRQTPAELRYHPTYERFRQNLFSMRCRGMCGCQLVRLGGSQWVCLAHAVSSRRWSKIRSPVWRTLRDGGLLDIGGKRHTVPYAWSVRSKEPTQPVSEKVSDCCWKPQDKNCCIDRLLCTNCLNVNSFSNAFITSLLSKPSHPDQSTPVQAEWGLCESVTTQTVPSCPLRGGDTIPGHQDKAAGRR